MQGRRLEVDWGGHRVLVPEIDTVLRGQGVRHVWSFTVSLQNPDNEANLLLPWGIQKLIRFSASEVFTPTRQGLCP